MTARIQLLHDTAANWTAADSVLRAGELGIEEDTGQFKIGDGSTAWTSLPYAGGGSMALDDLTDVNAPSPTDQYVLTWDNGTSKWIAATATGGPPSGAAGGVLSGTYPNPGFAADMATQAELDAHTGDTSDAHDASAISVVPAGAIASTDVQAALEELDTEKSATGHTHAYGPDSVDYLVGTASGGLSAEIVVGTTPGGELGGTWASPTVDATHSGSAHHTEDHDHDGSPTQKLLQANTHETPDTDAGTSSLHHTIGSGANQAAAGNHTHAGGGVATDSIWDAAGDLAVGTGSDTASKLSISVPAANILNVLGVVNGETTWSVKAVHDGTNPAALGAAAPGTSLLSAHRDHVHPTTGLVTTTVEVVGGGGDISIADTNYVTLATTTFDIAAGNIIIAELEGLILNNSGATKTYTVVFDVNGFLVEGVEQTTHGANASNRASHTIRATAEIRATNLAYAHIIDEWTPPTSANNTVTPSLSQLGHTWNTTTGNATGSGVTVRIRIKSSANTATQTFTVLGWRMRKI